MAIIFGQPVTMHYLYVRQDVFCHERGFCAHEVYIVNAGGRLDQRGGASTARNPAKPEGEDVEWDSPECSGVPRQNHVLGNPSISPNSRQLDYALSFGGIVSGWSTQRRWLTRCSQMAVAAVMVLYDIFCHPLSAAQGNHPAYPPESDAQAPTSAPRRSHGRHVSC